MLGHFSAFRKFTATLTKLPYHAKNTILGVTFRGSLNRKTAISGFLSLGNAGFIPFFFPSAFPANPVHSFPWIDPHWPVHFLPWHLEILF